MSRNIRLLAAAMTLGALASAPAQAVVLTGVSTAAGNTAVDFSTLGNVSFDLDLVSLKPDTTLTFQLEAGDGPLLGLDAIVRNLTLLTGIDHLKLILSNATFESLGTAVGFGGPGTVSGGGSTGAIDFAVPEFVDITIGNVGSGGTDWTIDVANLRAGDTFSMRVSVPEPGSLALVLGGLGAALTLRRRGERRA
jgi:hypothetical protein